MYTVCIYIYKYISCIYNVHIFYIIQVHKQQVETDNSMHVRNLRLNKV